MRHLPRRSPAAKRLGTLLALALLAGMAATVVPIARAASGTVILEVTHAEAINKNSDAIPLAFWAVQQDFYPKLGIDAPLPPTSLTTGREIAQRDWAVWEPAEQVAKTFPDISLMGGSNIVRGLAELWDADDIDAHDQFDISPAAGRALPLEFDVCTMRFNRAGDATRLIGASWIGQGIESDPARVRVSMRTADGKPFLPNNVSIADISPVQAVYHPRYIIKDKATALMLQLASSHPTTVGATINVSLFDGISTVTDSKSVNIPPEGLRVFFFDGSGTAAPFAPGKQPNFARLRYSLNMTVPADATVADPSGPFPNCVATQDNSYTGELPIIATDSPKTLYVAWDFGASAVPGESITPAPPSVAQVVNTALSNERLRTAIFPIAAPISAVYPGHALSLKTELEPAPTIFGWSVAAHIAGIDTLQLMPRNGWFAESSAAGLLRFGGGAIGMSLAEFAPHAVIAEQGYSQVAVHEQGHTFQLSRRPCSTGGVAELLFGLGCRDEYNHAAADGAPYLGSGYDVVGDVYPSGLGGAAGTREVQNAINIMDSTGARDGTFDRWIDNLSYDWLSEKLRRPQDPPLVAISGFVKVPGGLDAPSGAISGQLANAYRYDGIPDMAEATLGDAQGAGEGQFFVRLVTGQGERRYRFTPLFDHEGDTKGEYGFFALAVPWDPATTKIELVGPGKGSDLGNPNGTLGILIGMNVSSQAPAVTKLRAAAGKAPDLGAAQHTPPVIQPGERIVVAWDQQDADTAAGSLSAILYLTPPKAPGSLASVAASVPIAINLVGGQATLHASQLAGLPGDYGARIVVSDGVNTTSFSVAKLFSVQAGMYLPVARR